MKKLLAWVAGIVVVLVGVLAAAIVFGTAERPPPLKSVVDTAKALDRSGMPAVERYEARDGSKLAYRVYPGSGPRVAVLYHGSSDSSIGMHGVGKALAAAGVTAYAIDTRGHGQSGPAGDIAHVGQLEDDLADLVAHIRTKGQAGPISLVGHSSGGGYVLRIMGSPAHSLFDQFVVTAPYLHYQAPTSRGVEGGGWAKPFIPRMLALTVLSKLGIETFSGLPVVVFALPPDAPGTKSYSFRLARNYGPHDDYVGDVRANSRKLVLIAGADDEVFRAERYAEAFAAVQPQVTVQLLPGLKHMDMVSRPEALNAVVAAVTSAPAAAQ